MCEQWEGNKVAHNLIRHTHYVTGFSVWMENIPSHTLVDNTLKRFSNNLSWIKRPNEAKDGESSINEDYKLGCSQ